MSIFDKDLAKKQTLTERVFDLTWDEYIKCTRGPHRIKDGAELYSFLVQNNFPGKSAPWAYYILLGIDRLTWITGKHYDFHVDKDEAGHTKAIVVTEI